MLLMHLIFYLNKYSTGYCSALTCTLQNAQPDPIELQKQQESQRRNAARNRVKEKLRPQTVNTRDITIFVRISRLF